ncbi:hypothetical protein ACGFW5_24275 [Streptomyces sp. NPDC048416]|uniref:hypothetical protein n=1 Tax=Streptomyces sp. NPDC048416 TaxID=3365546 RepID=UPI00371AFD26
MTRDLTDSRPTHTPRRSAGDLFGTGVSAVVLTLGAAVTGYLTFLAYASEPAGPWDQHTLTNGHFAAGLALLSSALLAMLAWVTVKAAWLRTWWYAIPATLAVAALLRLTLLAPQL